MYYWTTNRHFKVETALLQFLSNLDYKNSFVYWTTLYEQKGKIMRIARFCTPSGLLKRYTGRLPWKTGHAYSVIWRMQVQKNWTSSRVPGPERLSWDYLYRLFLTFLIMESMWQFHFKSLETLRPSILALETRYHITKEVSVFILSSTFSLFVPFNNVFTTVRSSWYLTFLAPFHNLSVYLCQHKGTNQFDWYKRLLLFRGSCTASRH